MRYVPLREAEPGMVLAADLYDSVGRTLIGCHCELTESYLEKLEAYGFDGIYIEDKLSEGITIEECDYAAVKAGGTGAHPCLRH